MRDLHWNFEQDIVAELGNGLFVDSLVKEATEFLSCREYLSGDIIAELAEFYTVEWSERVGTGNWHEGA